MRCVLLLVASVAAQQAMADEPVAASSGAERVVDTVVEGASHPYQYFGLELGRAALTSREKGETKKSGPIFIARTAASFDFEWFVVDGGLGFLYAPSLVPPAMENKPPLLCPSSPA